MIVATNPQNDEKWRKSIPSKVFSNHFEAIRLYLDHQSTKFDLKSIEYYNKLKINNSNFQIDKIKKLLWNSWSTEYAFQITKDVDNDEYYKYALHWNFPQAYYSIYLNMTAFHETQGIANDNHEKSIKIFGNSVKDGHYPKAISFYCSGLHERFQFNNIEGFTSYPENFNGLSTLRDLDDVVAQMSNFLKSTRVSNAKHKREKLQQAKDRKFLNQKGEFLKKFSEGHWNMIYTSIPETTILNFIYRLRIKANYHDIQSFIDADINFRSFNESLAYTINYLNWIHESYIVKCIGKSEYEKLLNGFPNLANNNSPKKRYESMIT